MNDPFETKPSEKILIRIDPDIADLIPGFLNNRRRDVEFLIQAMKQEDFESIRTVGHRMKGDGGGYGFQDISTIGAALEHAATDRNSSEICRQVMALSVYLERIEIVYG